MTKHESHIALLLLALITAGVLGYQFVNSDDGETANYWTDNFAQIEVLEQQHDSRIEILPPDYYDNTTGYHKSILKGWNRFQNLIIDDDQQILPGDAESKLSEIESAIDEEIPL